jgi:hypothetical protein
LPGTALGQEETMKQNYIRLAVVGSRSFDDYWRLCIKLDKIARDTGIVIVSGGAKGADKLAERYANARGLELHVFPAHWDMFGKKAGMMRNREIIQNCDGLIAFWDGVSEGTANIIGLAKKAGKKLWLEMF